jgi:hypothetical protein
MPAEMVFSKPNGEPIAATHSPTCTFSGSPSFTCGSLSASILSTATSVRVSAPISLALYSRLSVSFTTMSPPPPTTCALVSTYPSGVMMNPEPCACRGIWLGRPGTGGSNGKGSGPNWFGGTCCCSSAASPSRCTWMLTTACPCPFTSAVKSGIPAALRGTGAAAAFSSGLACASPDHSTWERPQPPTTSASAVEVVRIFDLRFITFS